MGNVLFQDGDVMITMDEWGSLHSTEGGMSMEDSYYLNWKSNDTQEQDEINLEDY